MSVRTGRLIVYFLNFNLNAVPTNSVFGQFGHFAPVELKFLRDHFNSCVISVRKQYFYYVNFPLVLPSWLPKIPIFYFCYFMKRCVRDYDITETIVALVYYLHTCDLIGRI